ncbi:MAG TPA: lytic transglycosylase domain-containing protein [Candidatus Polarisedimenticolia bacterium]|nr:lytic transglycosylase domain-containing protein [Candidatus Polarisedimenticolia bacterium]
MIRRLDPLSGSRRALRCATLALASLVLAPLASDATWADVATLKSGRTIEVASFRLTGDRVELSLPGGGQIALPAGEVREIRRQPLTTEIAPPDAPPAAKSATEAPIADEPGPPSPAPGTSVAVEPPAAAAAPDAAMAAAEAEELLPRGQVDRRALMQMASKIARRHGVDEPLVHAVIEVESKYNPKAVSRAGAMGLMQLMPKTANRFSVADAFDPVQNVDAGVRYLKELLERYSGQVRLALAAYNAGEEAVERHGGIPPYRETIDYVKRVQRAAAR